MEQVTTDVAPMCPEGARLIPLGGQHGAGQFALVDADLWVALSARAWYMTKGGYAGASGRRSSADGVRSRGSAEVMHRVVMGASPDQRVDHINGNKLDNRRSNLRFYVGNQNSWNSRKKRNAAHSVYKGVRLHARSGLWHVALQHNKRLYSLGYFRCEEDAAKVYDEAARYYYGEFARTNFPGTAASSAEEILARRPMRNRVGFRGVEQDPRDGRWYARGRFEGKRVYLGCFPTAEDAARAYDTFALEKWGEKAKLNFPHAGCALG